MIDMVNISKKFNQIKAVDNISLSIKEGNVFGLIGTNGAGKSTILKMLAGIYRTDSGTMTLDGMSLYENTDAKSKLFYIPDSSYYFTNATPKDLINYYSKVYSQFDITNFKNMLSQFELSMKHKISSFSKGMQKQLAIICGICAKTKYIFCDETFDGLDPVMRQAVKSLFAREMQERGLTPVIASHNLRELEDICDYVGILHKGNLLMSKDLLDIKLSTYKIQCVPKEGYGIEEIFAKLEKLKVEKRGVLYTLIVRCAKEELANRINRTKMVFYELLPLSLEEIFIYETEAVGYDIHKLIF